MKCITILFSFFFVNIFMSAQQKDLDQEKEGILARIDSIYELDFFNRKYQYLDEEFKIIIPSKLFEETAVKYKYYRDRVKNYKDSLRIVMSAEFEDPDMAHIAFNRIGYTWLRLGYHIWSDERGAKALGEKWGIKYPYLLKKHILDNYNKEDKVTVLVDMLKVNLLLVRPVAEIDKLKTANEVLNYAMLHNPVRQADYAKVVYERKHGKKMPDHLKTGVSCGKENCCQTKVK